MGDCVFPLRHLLIWDVSDDLNCPKQRRSSGEKRNVPFLVFAGTVLWIRHKRSPKCNASSPHGIFDEFWSCVGTWEGAGLGVANPHSLAVSRERGPETNNWSPPRDIGQVLNLCGLGA